MKKYNWKNLINKDNTVKIVLIVVAIAVIGVFVFNRFSKNEAVESAISNVEIKEKKVEEVSLSMVPVQTLNPLLSTDEDVFYLSKLIYSSLFTFDKNMTPIGDLADDYSFDGDTVTIDLKNAKWHSEGTVDADDVKFTVNAIKSIGESGVYYEKANKIKKVSGSGKKVTIEFKDEKDVSLSYLTFPIVPKDEYKSVNSFKQAKDDFEPIGSGMFEYKSFDKSKELLLDINKSYYGEKAVSSVRVNVIKESSNRTKMTEASNLTVFVDKSADRATKITKKGIKIENFVGNEVEFIGFNFESEFMSNKNLRKAVAYATDLSNIIEEDYYNSATESDSLYYPGYLGTKNNEDSYKYSQDKAAKLIKRENFEDTNDDGILDSEDGKKLSLKIIVDETKAERVLAAERIAGVLSDINVDVEVSELSSSAYMAALSAGNFDIYMGGMSLDETMDFRSLLQTGGANNYGKYSNKKIDGYLDDFMSGKTPEQNAKIVTDIKEICDNELPYYCIGYRTFGIVKSPAFNGELNPTYNNPYGGIESWFCNYEERIIKDNEEEQPTQEEN